MPSIFQERNSTIVLFENDIGSSKFFLYCPFLSKNQTDLFDSSCLVVAIKLAEGLNYNFYNNSGLFN